MTDAVRISTQAFAKLRSTHYLTKEGILVVYVGHPVGALTPKEVEANCARAERWLLWLTDNHEDIAFSMPWLPHLRAIGFDDLLSNANTNAKRARGLRDDVAMALRCDAIVLVGGRISSGMLLERNSMDAAGLGVVDLTSLGDEPPARIAIAS